MRQSWRLNQNYDMGTYNGTNGAQARIVKIRSGDRRGHARISNETANDEKLGGLALGILTYALSKPSDWKLYSWELEKRFHRHDRAIRTAMWQLRDSDRVRLVYERAKDRITAQYWQVRESPQLPWPQTAKYLIVKNTINKNAAHPKEREYQRKTSTKEKSTRTQERVHVTGDAPDVVNDKAVALKTEEEERVCDAHGYDDDVSAATSHERTPSAARRRRRHRLISEEELKQIPSEQSVRIQAWNEASKHNPDLWPVSAYSPQLQIELENTIDLDFDSFIDLCRQAAVNDPEVSWFRKRKTLVGLIRDNCY